MIRYHMNNDALRLLLASLGGGITAAEAFLDSTLQKFLFREMVLFERAAKGEPAAFIGGGRNRWDFNGGKGTNDEDGDAEGSAVIPKNSAASAAASNPTPVLPTQESPVYITAYAQISGATRSYQTEICKSRIAVSVQINLHNILWKIICLGRMTWSQTIQSSVSVLELHALDGRCNVSRTIGTTWSLKCVARIHFLSFILPNERGNL